MKHQSTLISIRNIRFELLLPWLWGQVPRATSCPDGRRAPTWLAADWFWGGAAQGHGFGICYGRVGIVLTVYLIM